MAEHHAPLRFRVGAAMLVQHDITTAVKRESRFFHVSAWWRHWASGLTFQHRMERLCILYSLWLSFNNKKATDFGSLYNSAQSTWTIPTTGSYIVSMRGDPGVKTLRVNLYKNNRYLVALFYKHRTKSGQARVFQFTKGDTLWMNNDFGSNVGKETFMSIALLWVAPE
ncbi:uncharacterized protein [Littorina saxatilis]|uniref:uncharacterized protein n=1 Tax=Littorina saxatilis TaxID=31220 RepID=UPI0038B69D0D